jgi:CarboxypepD_reg-like domain
MKKAILLIITLICISFFANSQSKITISGYVYDASNYQAVPNAHLSDIYSSNGSVTNKNGFFEITVSSFPVELEISHLSYTSENIKISSIKQNWDKYFLEPSCDTLRVFTLNNNKIQDLIQEKPLFVYDYIHYEDQLLVLAYRNKKMGEAEVLLMNHFGDIIHSRSISKPKQLYRDCMGNCFLISNDVSYQILIDEDMIYLAYPMNTEEFVHIHGILEEEFSHNYFFKSYYFRSQGLSYLAYDVTTDSITEFVNIEDEEMIASMQWGGFFDNTPSDKHFEQLIVYKPIFAPMYASEDSLYLFNFQQNKIVVYDERLAETRNIPIDLHQNKTWKPEVYFDEVSKKAFTKFHKNGITTIKEISLIDGSLLGEYKIPGYAFIEKITVSDNYIYFLYKDNLNMTYKKLYRTKFDEE